MEFSTGRLDGTRHDQPGHELKPQVTPRPGEPVLHQQVNSAFIGTDLEAGLHALVAPAAVRCGLTTDHCVSTTARTAANLGFPTWVVADACATFGRTGADGTRYPARVIHDTALASLHHEFAHVITSGDLP